MYLLPAHPKVMYCNFAKFGEYMYTCADYTELYRPVHVIADYYHCIL